MHKRKCALGRTFANMPFASWRTVVVFSRTTRSLDATLILGASDFSPLRQSPACAERGYYSKNPPRRADGVFGEGKCVLRESRSTKMFGLLGVWVGRNPSADLSAGKRGLSPDGTARTLGAPPFPADCDGAGRAALPDSPPSIPAFSARSTRFVSPSPADPPHCAKATLARNGGIIARHLSTRAARSSAPHRH